VIEVAEVYFARCSVIKYRKGDIVLYPLAGYREKMKHLHGKKVYAIIIAED